MSGWTGRAIPVVAGALVALGCSGGDNHGARPVGAVPGGSTAGTGAGNTNAGAPSSGGDGNFGNPTAPASPAAGSPGGPPPRSGPCVNLQCQQEFCTGGTKTSISGVVLDPAGNNPLYNVAVYVPNEPVAPMPTGATCDSCDSLYTGRPIAAGLTDAAGRFVVENAPSGNDIPLVVQIGKWRRQFTIPSVASCQDNPQPDGMLRLPRNRSEGDIPKIAVATGSADTLECLLRRVGVDASEYVPAGGEGRVHIFQGTARPRGGGGLFGGGANEPDIAPNTSPPAPMAPAALWSSKDALMGYDIVLLSCEGRETDMMNRQALYDYANAGGRIFASHFHYAWFNAGPFSGENLANWRAGSNDIGNVSGTIVTTLPNGQPFPKGQALAEWLENVGALQNGTLPITEARYNADVTPTHLPSQSWILAGPNSRAPGASQYFSFNTPTNIANTPDGMYCGRVVFSDLHVGAASGDDRSQPVPASCADRPLSPQEAALEFMLFDLSSCLTPDDRPPEPPVVE
jgi:hypothetical protein